MESFYTLFCNLCFLNLGYKHHDMPSVLLVAIHFHILIVFHIHFVSILVDVHFDNFLYFDGKVKAIDFEALKVVPLDYQMDRWCRMCRHPQIYANKADKLKIKTKDYADIIVLMKKFYEEAFSFKNQDERLHLYSLIYNLNVMKKHNIKEGEMEEFLNEDMFL